MKKPPLWPLWCLCVAVPVTLLMMVAFLVGLSAKALYAWSAWVVVLFCYAHRMVYFYHVRQAAKWVYVVAMPLVLLMYPVLFVCCLFVAALQAS